MSVIDVAELAEDFGHRAGVSRQSATKKLRKVVDILLETIPEGRPMMFSAEIERGKMATVIFTKAPEGKLLVQRLEQPARARKRR